MSFFWEKRGAHNMSCDHARHKAAVVMFQGAKEEATWQDRVHTAVKFDGQIW